MAVAQPALTIDLRAISTSSGTVVDSKHVEFTGAIGDTVTMEVYFIISGMMNSNPFDDRLGYCWGSFLSSNGGLRGDLTAQLDPDYVGFLAFNGVIQDLDGDGDLDVGSNSTTSGNSYFRAAPREETAFVPQDLIATLTWTRTGDGFQSLINFRPFSVRLGAQWGVDGVQYDPTTAPYVGGVAVEITAVPEHRNVLTFFTLSMLLAHGDRRSQHRGQRRMGAQTCARLG